MHSPRRKNVVILVHGWNPGGQKNSYLDSGINERFGYLSNNLAVAVYDADWEVLQYHWEPDAATGPVIEGISDLNDLEKGFPNAIEAAEGAVQHGTHLGNILRDSDVESVHFICHSAGTWVARTAIAHLLQCSSKSAQITLLDPFVPGRETDTEISDSSLTEARIDEIDELSIDFPGRLVLLENYYAIDRWPIAGTNAGTDIYYFATSGEFDWRDDDVNRRIDFGLNYQSHSGPIEWYGDTVSDPVSDPEGINSDPGRGWLNSIYMQEPIIVSPPAWSSTLSGPSASVTATTRAIRDYNQENHLTYQWYRNGIEIDGEVGSSITISSPTAAKAGTYTVGVTNGELETMSGEAVLGVGDISGNFLIENVTNNPIPPTFFDQTITITGQGFTPSTTLLFHAPDGTPFPSVPAKLRYISEAELEYDINVYGDAGEWTVEAINGGFHSFPPYVFVASDQPTAPGSLVSIRVDGATSVEESGSADYRAYAHYTSGSPQPISPSWSVRGSAASIHSSSGVLSANAVGSDTSVDVVASFGGQEGTLRVEILDSSSGSGEVELIENGDFESGSQSWSLTGAEVTRGAYPYQGSRYLILGQTNNALDSASQTVTIPAHAASAELTYRLNVTSEHGTSSAEDLFFVVVREGGSDDFITGRSNIHQDDGPGRRYYRKYTHDLSDYIGDTVTIEFRVGTDEADSTAFRIDQVSLTAETPEEVRLVDLYINGPSVVDEDTTTNFDAVAVYSDGSTEVRSADWSENSRKASFSGDDFRAFNVDQDEDVRITAERTEGGVTRSATKTVTIREAHVVQYFTLNINAINGRVSRSPNSSSYAAGTEVTLTAIPNSGYEFSQWAGDTSGTAERKKIIIDGNKSITASFDPLPPLTGSLVVGLFPEAVIPSGAQWRLNGGAWQNPGVTMTAIPVGNHTVEFSPVSGWLTPAAVTITINEGQTARVDGTYTFNENSPLIFSVSPSQGPIDGNTLVTIRGANLADVVEVRFGGVPATSLEIITEGEIRLTTPPATAFGTVSVAVETGDETQTDPNGFNYAAPMGWNMELLAQLGGSVLAADVEGTMACFTHGARFKVMDLTNFSSPQVLGEVTLPDEGRYIEIENDLAFVASPFAGISVVDLSNPSEPVLIGSYDTEGQPTGMKVEDSLLYVCDGENGLLIFDVTAPSSPQLIGQLETSRHLTTVELTTGPGGEKLAIAAHYSGGIDVIDVTNPTAPFLTGSLTTPSGKAFNLRVQGSAAYLAVDSQGGLYAVNLSDPANPTLAKQINSPSFDAIEINGDYIYAGSRDWFRIFDISNPLDPTPAGSITMPDEINFRSFSRSGNRMVAAAHGGGFRVFDVSTASQPRLEGAFQPPIARGEDLVIDETHAYVSTREGFEVVDISSPGSPARVSGISMTNIEGRNPDELTKEGDIIYLSGSSKQVEGFDVSNPASPIRGDYYFNDLSALCVAAEGNLMFQGGFHQTLSGPHLGIIDVSNLNNFSFRSFVPFNLTSGSVRGVDVHGGIGYAAVSNYGLKIFDYSNPDAPTDLGGFPIGVSRFNNLRVVNQVAYLCEGDDGVRILDVSDPSNVIQLARIIDEGISQDEEMHVYDVDLDGNRLAVAGAFYGGVRVYDVANPSSPNLVAYYLPPSVAESVAIDGDRVFAALRNGGFAEFRITDYSPPTVAITQPASNPIVVQIPNINLSGTASDDVGVISVGWSNDAGGGGIASGTTSWSITDLPLQPGLNSLTISAVDSEGNIGSETIEVTFDDPKPTITSSLTTSGVYGQPFSYQISATNSPTSFDASNLPVGLSIDPSSGIISGTPAETLSADISISATNASGTGEATLVIEIDKITPSADWPAPASITYGTILNTAQLNATANVAGTFTYSPGTGTVLPYGVNQALSATFTPTDTEQYHSLSLQNSIDVIAQPGWFGRWADPQLMNPDGATDSGEHNWPEVVASPTGVWLAVWHGRENDALDFDAFISRSTDGGRTWTSPAFLNDDGASDSRTDTRPDLATDGNGRWVAVWRTTKPLSPTDHQRDVGIAFSISNDDGLTWSPFQPLSRYAVEGGNGKVDEEPRIATDGSGNWVVVWKSKRNPDGSLGVDRDIRAAYSTDDGASWSLPILVNSWGAMDADTDEDDQPEIAYGADGEWMVVWRSTYDHGPGAGTDTDIFFATSADVGATWSQPALVHAHGLTDGDDDDGVALVWAGDRWTVLWASDTWLVADGVDSDVVISVTTDSGATWSPPAPIHSYGSNDNRADGWPSVSYHPSDGLLVAWSSWVNHEGIIGTDPDILFTRSLDKGVTWEDFRVLNRNAYGDSGAQDLYPSLASDASGNVAVLWRSASILGTDLVGDWDIHFAHLRLTMSQLTNWLAGFYGHTPTDPSVLLPFSDSDGDGIMQIHEFSYGTNPLIAESEYSGESILPVAAVVDHGGSLYLEYTYRRRINPSAYGLSHALEVSSSLGSDSWSPAVLSGPEVVASNGDGLTESVTVRIEASSSAFFVRLRTTLDD